MGENIPLFQSVLIIDSDQIIQKGVSLYLKQINVQDIKLCGTGIEALEIVKNEVFDLIVLDWRMKNPNGSIIYEKIRNSLGMKQTPVILISGFITKEDVNVVSDDSKTKFIVKPFTEDVFIGTLNNVTGLKLKPGKKAKEMSQSPSSESISKLGRDLSIVKNTGGTGDRNLHHEKGSQQNENLGLQLDKNGFKTERQGQRNQENKEQGTGLGLQLDKNLTSKPGLGLEVDKNTTLKTGRGLYLDKNDQNASGLGLMLDKNILSPGSALELDKKNKMAQEQGFDLDKKSPSDSGFGIETKNASGYGGDLNSEEKL